MLIVIIVAVVAIVIVAAWWTARSRNADGVDSFRRQIDALSSEARRPVVEQLNVEHLNKDEQLDEDEPERSDAPADPDDPDEPHAGGASGT